VLTPRDTKSPAAMASLPCPGYWPVVRVFVPSSLQGSRADRAVRAGPFQLKGS